MNSFGDRVARQQQRRGVAWRAILAVTGLIVTLCVAWTPSSSAATPLKRIVCGGVKHLAGWQTNPSGGYVGRGCGAGIDFHDTPTYAWSDYRFGDADGASYVFWAWIPTVHATATIDFNLQVDNRFATHYTVYEQPLSGWIKLKFVPIALSHCGETSTHVLHGCTGNLVHVFATTGAYHGQMGLDAIEALPPGYHP